MTKSKINLIFNKQVTMTNLQFTPTFKGTFLQHLLDSLIEENSELEEDIKKLNRSKFKSSSSKSELQEKNFKKTENKAHISTLKKAISLQENEMNNEYNTKIKNFAYNEKQKEEIIRAINRDFSEIKDPYFIQELINTDLFIKSNDNPGPYVPEIFPVVVPEAPIFIPTQKPSVDIEEIFNSFIPKKESPKPNYTGNTKVFLENKKGFNSFSQDNSNNNNSNMNYANFGNAPVVPNVPNLINVTVPQINLQTQNMNQPVPKVPVYLSDYVLHAALDTNKLTHEQENWVFKILKSDSRDKIKEIYEKDLQNKFLVDEHNKKSGTAQKKVYLPIFTNDFAVYLVRERPNLIADIIAVVPHWNLSERIIYNAVRSNINFNKKSGKLLKSPLVFLHAYEPKFLMPFILLTVENNGNSIQNFPLYQTEKIQLAAVENDPKSIQYIIEPTPAVIKKVLDSDCLLVKYVPKKLITFEIKNFCIKKNGLSIVYIDEISEKQRVLAITSNIESIKFLRNKQTVGFQFVFLNLVPKNRFSLIKNIINPTIEVQGRIIELSIYNIQYIENPHWKIIVSVINSDPNYKKYGFYWTTWLKSKILNNSIKIDAEGTINRYIDQIIKQDFNRSVKRFKEILDSKKIVYSANSRSKMIKNDKHGNENNKDNNGKGNGKGNGNNNGKDNGKGNGNDNKGNNANYGWNEIDQVKPKVIKEFGDPTQKKTSRRRNQKKSSSKPQNNNVPDWWKGKPEDYKENYKKKTTAKKGTRRNAQESAQENTPKKSNSQ